MSLRHYFIVVCKHDELTITTDDAILTNNLRFLKGYNNTTMLIQEFPRVGFQWIDILVGIASYLLNVIFTNCNTPKWCKNANFRPQTK